MKLIIIITVIELYTFIWVWVTLVILKWLLCFLVLSVSWPDSWYSCFSLLRAGFSFLIMHLFTISSPAADIFGPWCLYDPHVVSTGGQVSRTVTVPGTVPCLPPVQQAVHKAWPHEASQQDPLPWGACQVCGMPDVVPCQGTAEPPLAGCSQRPGVWVQSLLQGLLSSGVPDATPEGKTQHGGWWWGG